MKSFIEVIKEADDVQARLKFIQDPKSSTKSIVGLTRNSNSVIKNAAEEELKRRRDSGDQEAGASVQPPKDPTMHSATTQVGGDSAQTATKTKEVEPNNIAPSKKGSKGREILNNLAKGKTITGDTPNAIELNPKYIIRADGIKEEKAPGKTVVFSFGRMNPPTIGHEKLVKAIEREASSVGGTPRLYLSRTEGDAKNPLPYAKKNKFAKLAFPIVKDTPTNMMPAGFIGLLKHLEDQFDDAVIVVGSDRLANIKKLAERYNGTEYKYNTIKVVSAGDRDPDEEGAAGMSASKMRQAVKDGNMAAFKAGLPSRLKGVAKTIFDELSKSLQEQFDYELDEAVLTLSQRLKRRAMMRRIKGKIRMGQKRALARKASGKTIKRRSKRIAIKLMRKRILRGRKYQDLSYSARAAVDRQVARRKVAISRLAKRVEPKLRQAEGRRHSGQGFKPISIGTPVIKKKLKEQMSRDNLIQVVTEMFSQIAEEVRIPLTGLEMATLRRKCNESNNSFETLRTVFDRGVASWYTGLREDSTPQQWGFARVNSFIANGKTRFTADRDLLEQDLAKDAVEKQDEKQSLEIIKSSEDTYSLRSFKGHGSTDKVKAAAAARLKELGIYDDAKPVAQPAAKPAPEPVQQQTDQQAAIVPSAIDPNRNAQYSAALALGKAAQLEPMSQVQQPPQDQTAPPESIDGQPDRGASLSPQEIETAVDQQSTETASQKIKRGKEIGAEIEQDTTTKKMNKKLEDLAEKHKSSFISGPDLDRFNSMIKGYKDFVNADTEEDRVEALRYLAENNLISSHSGGKKIYVHSNVLGGMKGNETVHDELRKKLAPDKGDTFSLEANRLIEKYGIEIEPGDDPGRLLADLSGKLHEAGITALIHPSPENTEALKKLRDRFVKAGGDLDAAEKQNEDAAKELRDYIQMLHEGAEIVSSQQVGGIGPIKLKELGIDPLTDPTDVIVTIKDKSGNLINKKFSFKTYENINNITMKNSGTDKAGEVWIGGEKGKKIDAKLKKMKTDPKYNYWADDIDKAEVKRRKEDLKKDYLKEFGGAMADLAKTKDGQQQLKDIWLKVHGCGNDVATLITNKKTNATEIKPPDYYCNPKGNFKVSIDGTKVVVNMEETPEGDEPVRMLQLDFKTEKRGSTKMLWRHVVVKPKVAKKASPKNKGAAAKARQDNISSEVSKLPKKSKKQKNESFLSFGDFLLESADKAVGNVPVISQKPIHHKASGHKYHIHHMINPDLALKHQVKHATQRFDRDVDSDIDQFDKPSAKFPDEVSVPTKTSTAKFFAKYKKEREHIHAGEPIDEQKIVFSEGPLSPIPKTAKPNLFHGNYGGKGNRGGEPVDKLDQAFQKHDTGYHYTPDSKKRLKHDKSLVKATSSIAKDKSQPIKTRVKAGMATALFKTKLALKKNIGEQTITPKYTGDENSWYLDAYGNKVQVYSQSDLKHPEDVGEFLKNPTREKDIGPMMSLKDFLKTQPEKKK